ncbi:MAG TPA: thiamine-binding protein [Pseudoclavibacter sp.]|nr:thiamine-binding protein [Pseudoclavibacter sp.]
MLLAFSVAPATTNSPDGSVHNTVAKAIKVIRDSGLPREEGSMFTTIEGTWDECFDVVRRATEAVQEDSDRVSLVIKCDIRPGYTGQITAKLDRITEILGEG